MAAESNVVVTALYPRRDMASFDMEYYLNSHILLTRATWSQFGMINCSVYETDKNSDFFIQVIMTWKDMDGWNAAQNAESTKKIMADIDNSKFTNVRPVMVTARLLN